MNIVQKGNSVTEEYSWTIDSYLLLHLEKVESLAQAQDIRDALEFAYQRGKKDRTQEIISMLEK